MASLPGSARGSSPRERQPRNQATGREPAAGRADAGAREHPPADLGVQRVNFLTVAEVAELMRVSKMTVYRLVHSGELTAARVGRSFRVPEQAVHDYLRDAYIEAG